MHTSIDLDLEFRFNEHETEGNGVKIYHMTDAKIKSGLNLME